MTFVAKGEEEKLFKKMEETIGITIDALPGIEITLNFKYLKSIGHFVHKHVA